MSITIRAYSRLLQKKAREQGLTQKLEYAVVTVIQRFGGSINLNPHFHSLWVDRLYDVSQKEPVFVQLPPPTDQQIRELVETISNRIIRCLRRKGYRVDGFTDEQQENDEMFAEVQSASVQAIIALGVQNFLDGSRAISKNGSTLSASARSNTFYFAASSSFLAFT